jgi:hypothetical protein
LFDFDQGLGALANLLCECVGGGMDTETHPAVGFSGQVRAARMPGVESRQACSELVADQHPVPEALDEPDAVDHAESGRDDL